MAGGLDDLVGGLDDLVGGRALSDVMPHKMYLKCHADFLMDILLHGSGKGGRAGFRAWLLRRHRCGENVIELEERAKQVSTREFVGTLNDT